MDKVKINLKKDHIHGNFDWEKKPVCRCGQIENAIKDKIIFVSNFTDQGANKLYFFPLSDDGFLHFKDGVEVAYCLWCGDKITAKKKYPLEVIKKPDCTANPNLPES